METILVVDDDAQVLAIVGKMLEGYRILNALKRRPLAVSLTRRSFSTRSPVSVSPRRYGRCSPQSRHLPLPARPILGGMCRFCNQPVNMSLG